MEDKDDKLINIFRKRLKDYEEPVGKDIWTSIEKELERKPSVSPIKIGWRYAGIAASILIIMGLGVFFLQYNKERSPEQLAVSKVEPENCKPEEKTIQDLSVHEEQPAETRTRAVSKNAVSEIRNAVDEHAMIVSEAPAREVKNEVKNVEKTTDTGPAEKVQSKQLKQPFLSAGEDKDSDLWNYPSGKKQKKNRMSYALAVGGNIISEQRNDNGSLYVRNGAMSESAVTNGASGNKFYADSYGYAFLGAVPNSLPDVPLDYHYNLPVSVGFLIKKNLSEALAVETGVVYTYLSSEETPQVSASYSSRDISLHYIGIPVKAVYSFYNNNRLSVYAAGGGMAEKSIFGKETVNHLTNKTSEKLNVPEIQWSLSGSVGLNYTLVEHLALFVEPGVGYYFDDGSDVKTIRKESPLNFTLQGGIRLTY